MPDIQTNAVAWVIGVIDQLHTGNPYSHEGDKLYKGIKNTIRDRYKQIIGVDPAPSYPIKAELLGPVSDTDSTGRDELRNQLLTLKDKNGQYVISSLIASEPAKLHALIDFIHQAEDRLRRETEKAYGNCRNCYGKGYATVVEYASGYDTDQDIGSSGGRVHFQQSPIKFCTCDRGKQLRRYMK